MAAGVDEDTVQRLARFHVSIMDGLFVGEPAVAGTDRAALVNLVAAGLHAHVLQSRVCA
jgi:hypothetical protein